jgi:hypothetical protein
MKVSFEVPLNYLYDFDEYQDYLFVLGHLCENETYKNYVMSSPKFKILDNSAYELGRSISVKSLCDIAEEIKADVIVVPDVLGNAEETLKTTEEFYKEFTLRPNLKNVKTMIVPQGTNYSEYLMCYYKMREFPYDIVGVSFYVPGESIDFEDVRLKKVQSIMNASPDKKIHLLGLHRVCYLYEYKKYLAIESIDTSLPIVLAIYGEEMTDKSVKEVRPTSYFDLKLSHEQLKLAKRNVEIFRNIVK